MRSAIGSPVDADGAAARCTGGTGRASSTGSGGASPKPKSKSKLSPSGAGLPSTTGGRPEPIGSFDFGAAATGGAIGAGAELNAEAGGATTGGATGAAALGAGGVSTGSAARPGRTETGFGTSRSCQLLSGSGRMVAAGGKVPKSMDGARASAGFLSAGSTSAGPGFDRVTGAATGRDVATGASIPGMRIVAAGAAPAGALGGKEGEEHL